MLISKEVEVNLRGKMIMHLVELGYELEKYPDRDGVLRVRTGSRLIIPVEDLMDCSENEVLVKCDYCGKEFIKKWYKYNDQRKIIEKDACKECSKKKQEDVMIFKYGVKTAGESYLFKGKIAENIRKYSIKDIRVEFENKGYTLLSNEYKNMNEKLLFICNKHNNHGIQGISYINFKNGSGCRYCGYEKSSEKNKLGFDKIKELFERYNYELLCDNYENTHTPLMYKCRKHPHRIQSITYDNFNSGKQKCHYCTLEESKNEKYDNKNINYDLFDYLRSSLGDWKKLSMEVCGYKCAITGERFENIHHINSYHNIIYKVLDVLNLELKNIKEYSNEELRMIEYECKRIHSLKENIGVCLKRNIHVLFHMVYGFSNNNREQFEEFKIRYQNSEFEYILKNINFNENDRFKQVV